MSAGMPRKPWRIRKVPKAVAMNGTAMPWNELNQSRSRTVWRLGSKVTSIGSRSVAMNTANITRLNGKAEVSEGVGRQDRREHLPEGDQQRDHQAAVAAPPRGRPGRSPGGRRPTGSGAARTGCTGLHRRRRGRQRPHEGEPDREQHDERERAQHHVPGRAADPGAVDRLGRGLAGRAGVDDAGELGIGLGQLARLSPHSAPAGRGSTNWPRVTTKVTTKRPTAMTEPSPSRSGVWRWKIL